ncbi:MAG: flagellar protein FliT [Gammaproteobacteria bacterium]|nr:flagellar protein FliT [Gammaproteobacteria bacterium]
MSSPLSRQADKVVPIPMPEDQTHKAELIRRILELSETMLTEAEASSWADVSEHDHERQRLAWKLSETPLNPVEKQRWTEPLQRILWISRQLTQIATRERDAVATQLAKMRQGNKAQKAYAAL